MRKAKFCVPGGQRKAIKEALCLSVDQESFAFQPPQGGEGVAGSW